MDFARGMLKLGHTGSLFVAKITGGFNADQKSLQKQHAGGATQGSQDVDNTLVIFRIMFS